MGHTVSDALQCLRNGPLDRGAHLFKLWPHRLGLRSNVLVNRFGNPFFIPVILCFGMRFFTAILLPAFIGELSTCVWLLVKGVNASKWDERLRLRPIGAFRAPG